MPVAVLRIAYTTAFKTAPVSHRMSILMGEIQVILATQIDTFSGGGKCYKEK